MFLQSCPVEADRFWEDVDEVFAMEKMGYESKGVSPLSRSPQGGEWDGGSWAASKGFRPLTRSLSEDSLYSQESFYEYDLKMWHKSSTAGYEAALISEAHGLITDMLADSNLPPHVVGGLRAVSNLLKPPDTHVPTHTKPKVSPLVSLAESTNYGSDTEDLPYTGERPSSLPKRLRRSLPPSLIRRMSTSTWTTTTSATGMPTLEAEPCRTRSSSFRHSRDNTPGSSPVGSRSNSPSPSSPTTISLTIPKSRSFSLASPGLTAGSALGAPSGKRALRERRSMHVVPCSDSAGLLSPVKGDNAFTPTSPVSASSADPDAGPVSPGMTAKDRNKLPSSPRSPAKGPSVSSLTRRLNVTSDYDSSDSPGNSDHSDNVTVDDVRSSVVSGSGPRSPATRRKVTLPGLLATSDSHGTTSQLQTQPETSEQGSSSETTESISLGSNNTIDSVASLTLSEQHSQIPTVSLQAQDSVDNRTDLLNECDQIDEKASDNMLALPYELELIRDNELLNTNLLNQWDYPIFDISDRHPDKILSQVSYKIFLETGLFETFRIPIPEFLNYFHALELGYREKPYHNRVHATDVLHGVYYLTTQPIPGFNQVNPNESELLCKQTGSSSESDSEMSEKAVVHRASFTAEETYGIMGGNFPALELMALYTAAAMHDYDHPGRTNAFLVTTHSSLAVLYNDRSVLESHHAASAWELLLSNPAYNWIKHLEKSEFKRFRFLVIEAILATDLKRHFEMVAEFNAKVNDDDAPGIDWTNETDRLHCSSMVIKLADINGPTKRKDLHVDWTSRITEEFYEQGDEEAGMGLPISPYMDRENPQLAKLQESFINHLVAPLLNCLGAAGMLPGTWEEDDDDDDDDDDGDDAEDDDSDKDESSAYKDTEDEETDADSGKSTVSSKRRSKKRIHCWLTKNLEDNHAMWVVVIKRETAAKEREAAGNGLPPPRSPLDNESQVTHLEPIQIPTRSMSVSEKEMESIKEEDTPPNSANSLKEEDHRRASLPVLRQTEHHSVTFAQPTVIEPDTLGARPLSRDQPLVSCLSPSSKKHEIPSSQQTQPTTTHHESSESSLQPKTLLDEKVTERDSIDSASRIPSGQGSLSQPMEMPSSVPERTSSQ